MWIHNIVVFLPLLSLCVCYNILVIFPHFGKSHFLAFDYMFKTLASKGHNVTVISFFPQKKSIPNYRDISITSEENITGLEVLSFNMFENSKYVMWDGANFISSLADFACPIFLMHPNLQNFLRENNKFDVVMVELFNTNCHLGLAKKFGAPIIGLSSCIQLPWYNSKFGNPDNPSYIRNAFMNMNDPMNFLERVENTISVLLHKMTYEYIIQRNGIEYSQKFIGEDPEEAWSNVNLFLINSHFTFHRPKPSVPSMIDVAGIHIEAAKPIPKDLEKFINESEHGVIYMSMGSMLRGTSLPKDKRANFLKSFSKLSQRVLWKWESEKMDGMPNNVKLTKWTPQRDLLCHPNIKAFITHGGLLGALEAVHCGVPMIIIPQYGDQFMNAATMKANGNGVEMYLSEATEETISRNLALVLSDEFRKQVKAVSSRFNDRPLSPMDTAVYWIEYVARHKGTSFMRTAAVDMPAYQYYLIDVILFIFVLFSIILFAIYKITSTFFGLFFMQKPKEKMS